MKTEKIEGNYWQRHLLAFLFYSVMISIAYSSALNGTWAMDDTLLNKPVGINDIRNLIGFRKVTYVTFLVNQFLTPLSAAGFRVFNILLHIVNTILVYIIAFKTTLLYLHKHGSTSERSKRKGRVLLSVNENRAYAVAFLSGIIFGLHPININAVTYIVQRMAALSAFFSFLSLLCYIRAHQSGEGFKKLLFYGLSGVFIITGILSKENAIMIIPLILLYDYVFLSGLNLKTFLRKVSLFLIVGIVSAGIVSYLLKLHYAFIDLVSFFVDLNKPLSPKGWMAVDVYWTPLQHFLTEFRVVSRYLFLIFAPLPGFLVFDWWGYPLSKSLLMPVTTLISFIFLLSLSVFSILRMRKVPLLSFGILWYIIAISLESFFALGADLYFEHRNYLPVSGLFIGIIGQLILSLKIDIEKRKLWIIAGVVGLILGSLTFVRNLAWKDSITLWKDTLEKVPYNIRALKAIGNSYLRIYDLKNAEVYFVRSIRESSIRRAPQLLDESVFALGMIYLYDGELEKTKTLIERYQDLIESYRPGILKGYYHLLNDDPDAALSEFNRVNDPDGIYRPMLFTLKGDAYRSKGLLDMAMREYLRAIAEDMSWASAYHGIGVTYMIKRDVRHAEEYFDKALRAEPDNVLVLSDMADLMLIKRVNPEKALDYARAAISKKPPFYQPYLAMGNVLLIIGKEKEAEDLYRNALGRGAKDYMIVLNKARIYYLKGDHSKSEEYLSRLKKIKDLPPRIRGLINK